MDKHPPEERGLLAAWGELFPGLSGLPILGTNYEMYRTYTPARDTAADDIAARQGRRLSADAAMESRSQERRKERGSQRE